MVLVDAQAGTRNAFEALDDGAAGVVLEATRKFGLAAFGGNREVFDVAFFLEDLAMATFSLEDGITTSAFSTI